jgi:transcriptional regulator with XRE-family HTH domain
MSGLACVRNSSCCSWPGTRQRRVVFLPWARARLKAPIPKDWTDKPVTLGDHLKKARKERRLLQREVAKTLGVDSMSLVNWEKNRTKVGTRFVPAIIQWLRYDPLPRPGSFGEWIAIERGRRGLARRSLAAALGWDEATVGKYEAGRPPEARRLAQLRAVLGKPPS